MIHFNGFHNKTGATYIHITQNNLPFYKEKIMLKIVSAIVIVTIAFIASLYALTIYFPSNMVGNKDFTLIDSNGKQVTLADIRAKPAVIFFGYTSCPDICPTTLFDMQQWLNALGPDADKLGVWFFTVDPERDTPEVLHDYLSNFSDKIIGVSGEPEKVHKAIDSFKIYASKVDNEDGEYTYDHTAAVILVRPGGKKAGIIPYDPNANDTDPKTQQVIERLKRLAALAKG